MKKEKGPSVVVVIPFYNGSPFIERALRSVFEQSTPPDEVIVVNDGSRVSERDFLHALAARLPFRVIDKPNGGQGSARNAGVMATKSDFICLLDQDDFFLETHIEVLTRSLPINDRKFGFLYADLKIADVDGNIFFTTIVKIKSTENPKTSLINLLKDDMFVLPSASIISRKAFEAVGGFDEQFTGYEDDDLFMRLFHKGYTNYFVDEPVTVWCVHSASTSFSIKMSTSRFRYFKKLMATFVDQEDRGLFFFRDCLLPRFLHQFVGDAVGAVDKDEAHRTAVYEILRDFSTAVLANRYVGRRQKVKLMLTTFLLTNDFPGSRFVFKGARRLPFVRRFVF